MGRRLGNNVRVFRLAAGESLADLAVAVDWDRSSLTRMERGIRGCPDHIKLRLAQHFGVSVTRLFFQDDGDSESPAAERVA